MTDDMKQGASMPTPTGQARKAGQVWTTELEEQTEAWEDLLNTPEGDPTMLKAAVKRLKLSHNCGSVDFGEETMSER